MLIDPPTVPEYVTSYDHWACAQTIHTLPCGNTVGQCNAVRSNVDMYRWTSQHDANVLRNFLKRHGTYWSVTALTEPSGWKIKASWCRDAWTLWGKPWTDVIDYEKSQGSTKLTVGKSCRLILHGSAHNDVSCLNLWLQFWVLTLEPNRCSTGNWGKSYVKNIYNFIK